MSTKTPVEKVDLRVRRTHKLLWEALMAELSERPFEEITVSDICDRAMVHRTTFYKHYPDKYALLEQGARQMFDELIVRDMHLPPSQYTLDAPPPYFIRLFEHAAEHQQFYRLMLCGEGVGRFQNLVKDYIAEVAMTQAHGLHAGGIQPGLPLEMHARFVSGGALSLLAWWLDHDMPLTPFQMAQFLMAPNG